MIPVDSFTTTIDGTTAVIKWGTSGLASTLGMQERAPNCVGYVSDELVRDDVDWLLVTVQGDDINTIVANAIEVLATDS